MNDLIGSSYSLYAESPKRQGQDLHVEVSGPLLGYYLVDVDLNQQFAYTTAPPTSVQTVRHIVGIGEATGTIPLHPQFLGQFQTVPEVISFPLNGLLGGEQGRVYYFQARGINVFPGGQQANSSPSALVLLDSSL